MTSFDRTEFAKALQNIAHHRHTWEVWSDWLTMAASSIANAVDKRKDVWQQREDNYMRIIKRYSKDELNEFCKLLPMVVDALEENPHDFLGQTFMALELYNKWKGQFFTPDSLCTVMAQLVYGDDLASMVEKHGYVTIQEPAVGGGATIIGMANAMRAQGLNYQTQMHVTAVDVDIHSVHMAYIQLSLLHVPAVIIHGNTLTLEEWSHWYTPAHILGGWGMKLRQPKEQRPEPVIVQNPGKLFTKDDQLGLFGE